MLILEDHSPFYIKFSHDTLSEVISICKQELEKVSISDKFYHHRFSLDVGQKILSLIPFADVIQCEGKRVSLFISAPGYKHFTHIDPASVSINYGIKIIDDLCITNWFDPKDISHLNVIPDLPWNRGKIDQSDFESANLTPMKSFIMNQDDAVLLNTQYYHNFDNSKSLSQRVILTIRPVNKDFTFYEAKNLIFKDACSKL